MTRDEIIRRAQARLERTLDELADRFPTAVARVGLGRGRIADPFLAAVVAAVSESVGDVEHRASQLVPRVFQRLTEFFRTGPPPPIVPTSTVQIHVRGNEPSRLLPAGTPLRTQPGTTDEGIDLRTTTTIALRPWAIHEAEYRAAPLPGLPPSASRRSVVTFQLQRSDKAPKGRVRRMRVYINASDALARQLLQGVFARGSGAFVKSGTSPWNPIRVRPVGLARANPMLGAYGTCGGALVREYFAFPRKFFFFDLFDLDLPARAGDATVALTFDTVLPGLQELRPHDLRLNCVPVVNLFRATPDGIRLEAGRTEYPVKLDRLPGGAELYSVDRVWEVGRDERTQQVVRRECPRQSEVGALPPGSHAWHMTRLGDDDGTVLSVVRTRHTPGETLTRLDLEATCTAGDRATRLDADLPLLVAGSSDSLSATLLHRPTSLLYPPVNRDPAEDVFSEIGPPRWSLLGDQAVDVLRQRLRGLTLSGWRTSAGQRPSWSTDAEAEIEGLVGMRASARGDYLLTFDPIRFPGHAPWLFAAVVQSFLINGTLGQLPTIGFDLTGDRRHAS